jgi:uncharacterized protein (TIGR02466 family)
MYYMIQNFEMFTPFGPKLYKSTIDQNVFDILTSVSTTARNNMTNWSTSGYTNGSFISLTDNAQYEIFYTHLKNHITNYLESAKGTKIDYRDFDFNFDPSMWVNFQRAGDFNSLHVHEQSKLSVVIYLKVPQELKQELDNWKDNSPARTGMIEFVHGSKDIFCTSTYSMLPEEGDILIFPSHTMHQVYPFKSSVERWSLNVNITRFNYKEI